MITLRVLGASGLCGPDGAPLGGVLRQPKRFGLFCYLALRKSPGDFVSRDRLLGVFWPDLDPTHGRASLRQALSYLTARIGPEVLLRRGGEELAVSPGAVDCDAWAFCEDLETGRLQEGVDAYRGPLLDGFYLSSLPDFDQWLESRRLSFHERAGTAAWQLCAQAVAGSDIERAAFWGKRAIELAGFDEGRAGWLMKVLTYHGDRVGALRVYRGLEEHLRAEFELRPSEEIRALAERIRSGEAAMGPAPAGLPMAAAPVGLGRRSGTERRAASPRRTHQMGSPTGTERRGGPDRRVRPDRRTGPERRRPVA